MTIVTSLLLVSSNLSAEDIDFKNYIEAYDGAGWNDPYAECPDCEIPEEPEEPEEPNEPEEPEQPDERQSLKIAVTSDFHYNEYDEYSDLFGSLDVDFMVVNGDLSGKSCYSLDSCKTVFDGMPYPYYFNVGNHDKNSRCVGHEFDYEGNKYYELPKNNALLVLMDMCYPDEGEGIFTDDDEQFLENLLQEHSGGNKDLLIFSHCITKIGWADYHWSIENAAEFNSLVESYSDDYRHTYVVSGHNHVSYMEQTSGVNYATIGRFGLCPYEYGILEIDDDASISSLTWRPGADCSYPHRHSDSSEYHFMQSSA